MAKHVEIGLGLAPGGLYWGNVRVGFYVICGTWEASNSSKDILIFDQEIFVQEI